MRSIVQIPPWIYQRYSHLWARAFLAAGWTALYVLLDSSVTSVLAATGEPWVVQWRIALASAILIAGLFKPVIAYALFIVAIAYPLYLISIYVAALALATLILSAPLVVPWPGTPFYRTHSRIPLAWLILAAPLLCPYHVTPALPLIFGLWAGSITTSDMHTTEGAWTLAEGTAASGLTALWLKICAGMAGQVPDLWAINGWTVSLSPIYDRFYAANSLQTLVRMFKPLWAEAVMPSGGQRGLSTALLFNLLQVCAWAGTAYLVGALRAQISQRPARRPRWCAALSLGPGLLMLWAGYVAVPAWLQMPRAGRAQMWGQLGPRWLPAQILLAGCAAWALDALLVYLRQPLLTDPFDGKTLPNPSSLQQVRSRQSTQRESAQTSRTRTILNGTDQAARRVNCSAEKASGDDIIMIELD